MIRAYVFLAALVLAVELGAAPAPKKAADVLAGELDLTGPRLEVTTQDEDGATFVSYWLVFPSAALERKAAIIGEDGSNGKARVTGRIAAGGRWKYLIVESIEPIE